MRSRRWDTGPLPLAPVTSTRERQKEPASGTGTPPWAERSLFPTVRGVPVWATIAIAVVLTAIGSTIDQVISSGAGVSTMACYFVGCVGAVALAQRNALFGPMVQAPLVITLVLPLVVLVVGGGPTAGGMSGIMLSIASPLISNFPMMAVTTAATLGIGLARMYYLQRADDADEDEPATTSASRASAERAAPAETSSKRPGSKRTGRSETERRRPTEAKSGEDSRRSGEARRGRDSGSGRQRSAPPGRGGPRPAPGRGRPPEARPGGEPPRRPRRPRGDS